MKLILPSSFGFALLFPPPPAREYAYHDVLLFSFLVHVQEADAVSLFQNGSGHYIDVISTTCVVVQFLTKMSAQMGVVEGPSFGALRSFPSSESPDFILNALASPSRPTWTECLECLPMILFYADIDIST